MSPFEIKIDKLRVFIILLSIQLSISFWILRNRIVETKNITVNCVMNVDYESCNRLCGDILMGKGEEEADQCCYEDENQCR